MTRSGLEVVSAVLDLYDESYLVVSTLAGVQPSNSQAVEAWYKEANEAKGWGIYPSSGGADTTSGAEEGGDPKTREPAPPREAVDESGK